MHAIPYLDMKWVRNETLKILVSYIVSIIQEMWNLRGTEILDQNENALSLMLISFESDIFEANCESPIFFFQVRFFFWKFYLVFVWSCLNTFTKFFIIQPLSFLDFYFLRFWNCDNSGWFLKSRGGKIKSFSLLFFGGGSFCWYSLFFHPSSPTKYPSERRGLWLWKNLKKKS